MLPRGFEQPVSGLLILAGLLACFAGHRFFRLVLGIYGFIVGAMIASSTVGVSNTTGMIVAALVGGFLGSVVLVFAWFAGVALVGAGMGVFALNLVWSRLDTADPQAAFVIGAAVVGAIAALFLQRHVVIVGTAFAGAWTLVVAALPFLPRSGVTQAVSAHEVWILYPTSAFSERWALLVWMALGLLGTVTQYGLVSGRRRR